MKIIRQNFINKRGFTLAEVLITLGIIGVVAALTVPTLIVKQQKKEYVTKLKKTYTTINQALVQMSNDAGCPGDLKCTGLFETTSTHQTLADELKKHIKISKDCGITGGLGCFPPSTNPYFDGSASSTNTLDGAGTYKFISNDGVSFWINNYSNECSHNYSNEGSLNMSQVCAWLIIDVNGLKKPNNEGRDTFRFFVTNGKGPLLYPRGGIDDKSGGSNNWWKNPATGNPRWCNKATDPYGSPCAGRIMEENWEMNY